MATMRNSIATGGQSAFPTGLVMPWPADMALPPGVIWLEDAPDGTITAEALQILQAVTAAPARR